MKAIGRISVNGELCSEEQLREFLNLNETATVTKKGDKYEIDFT